ncbi:energy transducer TonB [Opitutus sp. ER46]|uniref:energy transducer TonB n=1 Tax=Opitutus sp. ER46 TaxID=2161864 RepID=UPI001304F6E6|nr:energy transducer TonB [Opitutus sp. ER46]
MNLKSSLLLTLTTIAAFTATVSAKESCAACGQEVGSKPVPVKIVNPSDLPPTFKKASLEVVLTVDENGVPHDVRAIGLVDEKVEERVVTAVSQWRFTPSYLNGRAIPSRVVLPLDVLADA